MVRYLHYKNTRYMESNDPYNENDPVKSGETKTKSFFWNEKAKKPTKITFLILISFTLIFLTWGIVYTVSSNHEIKLEIDYSDDYTGYIEFYGTIEPIVGNTGNEFTFQIREGNEMRVYVRKMHYSTETLTIKIYDDDELVREEYITDTYGSINFEYLVGE